VVMTSEDKDSAPRRDPRKISRAPPPPPHINARGGWPQRPAFDPEQAREQHNALTEFNACVLACQTVIRRWSTSSSLSKGRARWMLDKQRWSQILRPRVEQTVDTWMKHSPSGDQLAFIAKRLSEIDKEWGLVCQYQDTAPRNQDQNDDLRSDLDSAYELHGGTWLDPSVEASAIAAAATDLPKDDQTEREHFEALARRRPSRERMQNAFLKKVEFKPRAKRLWFRIEDIEPEPVAREKLLRQWRASIVDGDLMKNGRSQVLYLNGSPIAACGPSTASRLTPDMAKNDHFDKVGGDLWMSAPRWLEWFRQDPFQRTPPDWLISGVGASTAVVAQSKNRAPDAPDAPVPSPTSGQSGDWFDVWTALEAVRTYSAMSIGAGLAVLGQACASGSVRSRQIGSVWMFNDHQLIRPQQWKDVVIDLDRGIVRGVAWTADIGDIQISALDLRWWLEKEMPVPAVPPAREMSPRDKAILEKLRAGVRPGKNIPWKKFCDGVRDTANGWVDTRSATGFSEKQIKRVVAEFQRRNPG
jgi:hypothetical protein